MKLRAGDRVFITLVWVLTLAGFAIFSSAALGLLVRESASVSRNILLQAGLGLGLGLGGFLVAQWIPLSFLKRHAMHIFLVTLGFTLLVFVPGIGFHSGGATRWINLHFTTVQPAEFLKIGFVLMIAAWLSTRARQLSHFRTGLIPFCVLLGIPALVLLAQPNTSTTLLLVLTGSAMYFAAGAPLRDFGILFLSAALILGVLVIERPYVRDRLMTFLHPSEHSLGSGYQIQQSLIAIGSGGAVGRGFGQSIEKFNYLPEPDGDSIFAVFAEETGFVGSVLLLLLFVVLAARGIVIAGNARDLFGGLVALGFSFLILLQTLTNIGAMLGFIPLTGLPLPFISHGGTALLAVLMMSGFVVNISSSRPANT